MINLRTIFAGKLAIFGLLLLTCIALQSDVHGQQRGMITSIGDGSVRINWGTLDGIIQGVVLNVYREDVRIHPATGEQIGVSEKFVGKIEVTSSQPEYSTARIIDFAVLFALGDIIRISYEDTGLAAELIRNPEKGVIQNVDNLVVTFNMGIADGVERNLFFDIYRVQGESVHPVTGEPINAKRLYIGRLQVTGVTDEMSTGQIIEREQDIFAGDRVELSSLQAGDMAVEPQQIDPKQETELPVTQTMPEMQPLSEPSNVVGTVTRVSDRDIYFIWRADYGFPAGRVFGIFRRIEIRHPESGLVIDNPLIQIGTATLRESIGKLGKAFIASFDDDIVPNDLIGLTEGETMSSGQLITPENIEQVYEAQRSDILGAAQELANSINLLQTEMAVVRRGMDRLDRIDRDLAAQKALTQQTFETLNEIKMMLRGEGYSLAGFNLPQSRTSVERIEFAGTGMQSLRLNYTDDIKVNFQLKGNNLLVSLDVDSMGNVTGIRQTESIPASISSDIDTSGGSGDIIMGPGTSVERGESEIVEETPFYKSLTGIIIIIFVLFGILGALYFFVLKKKKSVGQGEDVESAADEERAESEDIGEAEESDEDFGDEIVTDEEEIESFEEEESA